MRGCLPTAVSHTGDRCPIVPEESRKIMNNSEQQTQGVKKRYVELQLRWFDLRREEPQQETQIRLAGIVDSAMDAIITVDEEQRIVLFNVAGEKMFLYPVEDVIGQSTDRLIPERFRPAPGRATTCPH